VPARDGAPGPDAREQVRGHFTYSQLEGGDLAQGDLLGRTPELTSLLETIHRHYAQEKYTHFLVLTQTCDLVRHEKYPKAHVINLAVVRPVEYIIDKVIDRHRQDAFSKAAHVCQEEARELVTDFIEKLLNNNHTNYFYLHRDPDRDMQVNLCALLRQSFPILARQNYDICLKARELSLSEGFRAKLGWTVGNIYSRVGTQDWVPDHIDEEDFEILVNKLATNTNTFVPNDRLSLARKRAGRDLSGKTAKELHQIIESVEPQSAVERAAVAAAAVVKRTLQLGENEDRKTEDRETLKMLRNALMNDVSFRISVTKG
jgi:hypothetical protein